MDMHDILTSSAEFRYMMLDRLRIDCLYYLGEGHRHTKHLWAHDPIAQVQLMRDILHSFPPDMRPEWLTLEDVQTIAQLMAA